MFLGDIVEFAEKNRVTNALSGIGDSIRTAKRYGKELGKATRKKDWDAVKGIGKEYFTGRTPNNKRLNYKRTSIVGLAGVGLIGTGAYGTYRAGKSIYNRVLKRGKNNDKK